jgi:hypothetical protein
MWGNFELAGDLSISVSLQCLVKILLKRVLAVRLVEEEEAFVITAFTLFIAVSDRRRHVKGCRRERFWSKKCQRIT